MKKSKKAAALLMACALVFSLCACQSTKQDSTQPDTAAVQTEGKDIKTGFVVEASMNTLTITSPDGSTYIYTVDDTTVFEGESENLGDTVSVTCDGEYKENAVAETVKVIEKADSAVSDTAKEVKNSSGTKNTSSDKKVKYITAVVKDASMNNVTVEWGGKTYNVKKTDKTTVEGDITVGDTVRIYHLGDMKDGIAAIDISVVAPEIVNKDIRYITGKVVEASMNTIVIENNGHKYSVKKTDETKSDSVSIGDTVRVYHKGSYADGMTATSIIKQ